MKKLTFTKKETIRLHRVMWNWLAKNPTKQKGDWPGWKNIKENVMDHCFACQYAIDKGEDCTFCPFSWGIAKTCQDVGSPYREWFFTDITQTKDRACFALEVATLKIRKLTK